MPLHIRGDTRLDAVDGETIQTLLLADQDEDLFFDFKEGVDSDTVPDKYAMRKALASFANTQGGCLCLGILDKGHGRQGLDRLVGIANTAELGKRLTQKYIDKGYCLPAIFFEGPRIVPVDGADVAIVKVPRSDRRPHAIRKAPDSPLEFWARGSGTATAMDYDYLLTEIDQSREARGWLNALYIDLLSVVTTASENKDLINRADRMARRFHSIITNDAGNVPRVLSTDIALVRGTFFNLKQYIASANDVFDGLVAQGQMSGDGGILVLRGNNDIAAASRLIESKARQLLQHLLDHYPTVSDLKGIGEQ